MENPAAQLNVPVRQDIMPPPKKPLAPVEVVSNIPVREQNQVPKPQYPQQIPAEPQPEDPQLENVLKEVNQQVAAVDKAPQKTKILGFLGSRTDTKQTAAKKLYLVDAVAVAVAIGLIAMAVRVYR